MGKINKEFMVSDYFPVDNIPSIPPSSEIKSDQVYSAIIQEEKIRNVIEQLNPERLIIEIEFRLKGYRKNIFTQQWELIGKSEKPVSNELISDFLSILSSNLTNNTTLSNFTPDEINKLMATFIRNFIDIIRMKSKIYGLEKDYAERKRILLIVLSTIFYALKRGQGGLESKRLFDAMDIKESVSPSINPNKDFFKKLLG